MPLRIFPMRLRILNAVENFFNAVEIFKTGVAKLN